MKDHAYSRLMLAIKPHQAISRSQGVSGTNIYHPAHQLFVVLVLGGGSVWACASFHITLCQTSPTLAFVFIASPCRHAYTITWTRLHTTGSNACNQARSSNHKVCQEQRYITKLITWFEWSFGAPDMVLVLGGGSVWACATYRITLCQTSLTLASVFIAMSTCFHERPCIQQAHACNQATSSNLKVTRCLRNKHISPSSSVVCGVGARWRLCLSMC